MAFLAKLNQREKSLVGFLILVLASLPFFIFTIPAWKEYTALSSKITSDKRQAISLNQQINSLDKLKKEGQKLEKKLQVRKSFLAMSYEIDFLVQDLKSICDESSVSLESFTPSEPEPVNIVLEKQLEAELSGKIRNTSTLAKTKKNLKNEEFQVDLYKFPIEVKVVGNFTDILELFRKLEKYGRVISVENISIGKLQVKKSFSGGDSRFGKKKKREVDTSKGTLSATFNLIAYSLPDKNEVLPFTTLQRSSSKSSFRITKRKNR